MRVLLDSFGFISPWKLSWHPNHTVTRKNQIDEHLLDNYTLHITDSSLAFLARPATPRRCSSSSSQQPAAREVSMSGEAIVWVREDGERIPDHVHDHCPFLSPSSPPVYVVWTRSMAKRRGERPRRKTSEAKTLPPMVIGLPTSSLLFDAKHSLCRDDGDAWCAPQ